MYSLGAASVIEVPERLYEAEVLVFIDLAGQLLKSGHRRLILDCSQVKHISSLGIETLLGWLDRSTRESSELQLAAVAPNSAIILELMRVDRFLRVFATVEQAAQRAQEKSTTNECCEPLFTPPCESAPLKLAS